MSADTIVQLPTNPLGVKDQYADGKAALTYNQFIGDHHERTQIYRDFLVGLLRKKGCKHVLDAACGTGIDSMMLVEEGFQMVSVDASDKMLKHAIKARWERRKDPRYDQWIIEEAHWETLPEDMESILPGATFDAVICIGNSFAHLLDEFGDQRMQKKCLRNFAKCLKPGGLFFIDHRNFDDMVKKEATPGHSYYYNCKYPVDIKTTLSTVRGAPVVTLDYCIDGILDEGRKNDFRLFFYPHQLSTFSRMLDEAFDFRAQHQVLADFKPLDQVSEPAFYIHVLEKAKE